MTKKLRQKLKYFENEKSFLGWNKRPNKTIFVGGESPILIKSLLNWFSTWFTLKAKVKEF